MKNHLIAFFTFFAIINISCQESHSQKNKTVKNLENMKTLYDFKVKTIDGADFDLASLKGKKVLVVNTASKCGLTPQYEKLQELYLKHGGDNFTIIGFPANNFMSQEPGSNNDIAEFCQKNYGVTFQMMEKISVKGKDIHPLYKWLTSASENGVGDFDVKWNFHKFLIDENGKLVKDVNPQKSPMDDEIMNWISAK
jgi:glutathione peroxidase